MRKARGHDLLSSSLQAESPAHFWAHASFRFCTYSGRRIEGKGGELQKKGGGCIFTGRNFGRVEASSGRRNCCMMGHGLELGR